MRPKLKEMNLSQSIVIDYYPENTDQFLRQLTKVMIGNCQP